MLGKLPLDYYKTSHNTLEYNGHCSLVQQSRAEITKKNRALFKKSAKYNLRFLATLLNQAVFQLIWLDWWSFIKVSSQLLCFRLKEAMRPLGHKERCHPVTQNALLSGITCLTHHSDAVEDNSQPFPMFEKESKLTNKTFLFSTDTSTTFSPYPSKHSQ